MRTGIPYIIGLFLLCLPGTVNGQMVFKGLGNSNSTFLLGHTSAVHTQCLYLPQDLSPAGQAGFINRLYYRYGTTGQDIGNTLGDLRIRLGQTSETTFPNGNQFMSVQHMALHAAEYMIPPGTTGEWFAIDLEAPLEYDPTKTLIVDIMFATTTTINFGTLGTNNNGRKLRAEDTTSTIGSNFPSTTWQDIGFDLETPTGINQVWSNAISIRPNPFVDAFDVDLNGILEEGSMLDLRDISGRTILARPIARSIDRMRIDLAGHPAGIYFVRMVNGDGKIFTQKVVKE
jgi:hypothetical protein